MSKKHVYKVGDRVTILRPRFIKRVGYELHPDDLKKKMARDPRFLAALEALGLKDMPENRAWRKLLSAVCFAEVAAKGFGGRERKLHYKEVVPLDSLHLGEEAPDLTGCQRMVTAKRTVKTGTYYAPWSGYTYDGEYDNEPGGLSDEKTHVLLEVNGEWIEQCDVEPWVDPSDRPADNHGFRHMLDWAA